MREADRAMYRAKRESGNSDPEPGPEGFGPKD